MNNADLSGVVDDLDLNVDVNFENLYLNDLDLYVELYLIWR